MVRCLDCKNLIRIYVDSAFARVGEKKICKVTNWVFEDYFEIEKVRECTDYDPCPLPTYIRMTAAEESEKS